MVLGQLGNLLDRSYQWRDDLGAPSIPNLLGTGRAHIDPTWPGHLRSRSSSHCILAPLTDPFRDTSPHQVHRPTGRHPMIFVWFVKARQALTALLPRERG